MSRSRTNVDRRHLCWSTYFGETVSTDYCSTRPDCPIVFEPIPKPKPSKPSFEPSVTTVIISFYGVLFEPTAYPRLLSAFLRIPKPCDLCAPVPPCHRLTQLTEQAGPRSAARMDALRLASHAGSAKWPATMVSPSAAGARRLLEVANASTSWTRGCPS